MNSRFELQFKLFFTTDRLLEDLQDTVVTPDERQNGAASEYREYRMFSSSKTNDQPAQTTEEKWVEYGTRGGGGPGSSTRLQPLTDSAYSSSSNNVTREKTVNFSDDTFERSGPGGWTNNDMFSSTTNKSLNNIEFRAPANTTTVLSE